MAESFGVKMGVEGEKEFKNALKEINSAFKVLGSEMNLVTSQFDKNDKSIQSLSARNGVLTKEIEAQKNKVQTLQAALENASSSFGEADSRTRSWQIQLNNAQADLNKMESELKANEDAIDRLGQEMEEAEEQTDDFAESLSDSGDVAEDSSGKFEKVGSVVAGVGTAIAAAAAAIGAAVVAAGVELVKLGDEYNKAVNQISASTGATGTELEELGAIAQKVYTNNFGDSLEDVAEGLSIVQKTTGLVGDELQKATESGFALRDTFGYFITSVNWRSLYLDILDFVENSVVGIDALECLIESEKIMNEFLRGKRNDLGKIENHIFFFDDIKELFVDASNFADLKPHATFHRGIGSYTFCYEDEKTYGTLTNMMGVILVTLYHKGQREVWNNTEILNGVGRIEAKDQQIQSVFGNELIHIMETAKKASEAMSVAQQKKAEDRIKAAGEDVKNYSVFQDWMNDMDLKNRITDK